jgi:primosomal protein N''
MLTILLYMPKSINQNLMLGKMVEKQKVEILKMVERTKGRIAKCRNYY